MQKKFFLRVLCTLMIALLAFPMTVTGEESSSTRWADAADELTNSWMPLLSPIWMEIPVLPIIMSAMHISGSMRQQVSNVRP